MLSQIGVFGLSLLLFTAWGLPFSSVLRGTIPALLLSTPAFGAGLLAVVTTLLYVFGLDIPAIAAVVTVLSALSALLWHRTGYALMRAAFRAKLASAIGLVSAVIICSPILQDRVQFTVFQGNHWDQMNYLTASAIFERLGYQDVAKATDTDFLTNPLLPAAQKVAELRPSSSILFATVNRLLHGTVAAGGYGFVCSFAFSGLLAFAGLLLHVFGSVQGAGRQLDPAIAMLFGSAYACGFWGQYPVDIDAWAQTAATPLLLSAWTFFFGELTTVPGEDGRRDAVARLLALGVLIAGALYLYPEGALYHGLMLAGVVIVAGRLRVLPPRIVVGAVLLALALSALFWSGTLRAMVEQGKFATTQHVSWARYFDGYLFGQDPVVLTSLKTSSADADGLSHGFRLLLHAALILTGAGGIAGLYALTPTDYSTVTLLDTARGVLLLLALAGIAVIIRAGWCRGDRRYRLVMASAGIGLFGAALLAVSGQTWSAGKALSYAAPLGCLAIAASVTIKPDRGWKTWLAVSPWLLAQAWFAALTLAGLSNPDGIRLRAPYPAINDASFKTDIDWDIAAQLHRVQACPDVEIVADNLFFRQFVAIELFERGQPYFYRQPVNTYYDSGRDVGTMAGERVEESCAVTQETPGGIK
jgi:tetrahydromethanopterin S-methyltransferase subunit F